jgi:hypothetical protein
LVLRRLRVFLLLCDGLEQGVEDRDWRVRVHRHPVIQGALPASGQAYISSARMAGVMWL